jgi:pimeloyl-ACP methyl ester carboxylesterase
MPVMKNYSWLVLLFLVLAGGCKEDTEIIPKSTATRTNTNIQSVTAVDGSITQVECSVETLNSGEIYQICKPANWNGELIIYAHGYVNDKVPLRLSLETAAYAPLFTSLGFAFATTSLSQNGLAIQSGIQDIIRLRERFIREFGQPSQIYLTGASEGGIVTTLAVERYPELFSGGLSLCGPCGNFQKQVNYYANFRVLFDYFFKGVLPENAINIPEELITNWRTVYIPAILAAIKQNPGATLKLLRTAQAPYDPDDPTSIDSTVINVLKYDVLNTRDAVIKLGGQPFDNTKTVYFGTGSFWEDYKLNARVQRFSADPVATQNIRQYYETSGDLDKPLVMMHTTKDPIQLFWHLPLYQYKTIQEGSALSFTGIPVNRYGHCTFKEAELVSAFGLLIARVKGQELAFLKQLLASVNPADGKIIRSVRNQ